MRDFEFVTSDRERRAAASWAEIFVKNNKLPKPEWEDIPIDEDLPTKTRRDLILLSRVIPKLILRNSDAQRDLNYPQYNPQNLPVDWVLTRTFLNESAEGSTTIILSKPGVVGRTVIIRHLELTRAPAESSSQSLLFSIEPSGLLNIHGESRTNSEPGVVTVWDRRVDSANGVPDGMSVDGINKARDIVRDLIKLERDLSFRYFERR